jgi:hypothetical protein
MFMRMLRLAGIATVFLLAVVVPVFAQAPLTSGDIERLQDAVYDVGGDITRTRDRDVRLAEQLQQQLDEIREEAIYLKVKLRKEGSVPRSEYVALRDRLERLRSQARGEPESRSTAPAASSTRSGTSSTNASEVPVGTEVDARLQTRLSSKTAKVEDRFDTTTLVDVERNGRVLIPAGSVMRGVVNSVTPAGRLERKGSLTLLFDRISINGRTYTMRGTVTKALESEGIRGETERIATGGAVGAIIGGILGGFKGALAGILIGAGGTVAATEGEDVDLPPGTVLRVRFDSPLVVGQ